MFSECVMVCFGERGGVSIRCKGDKMKPPYPGWCPYCLVCSTMMRMEKIEGGYRCRNPACKNEIDENMMHKGSSIPTLDELRENK